MPGQDLQIIDVSPADLVVRREAAVVLAEAQKVARELQGVISAKPKKVMLNGEQYLEFEDWQTVGRFYGVTARVDPASVQFVQYGHVSGFKATADAVRADGFVLSSATSACLSDEEKWGSRPKYDRQIHLQSGEWATEPIDEAQHPKSTWVWLENPRRPESRRVRNGEESVPLFQVMSMAETRACAKVLRQVLAWVVVLAGYRPTPAEELPQDDGHDGYRPAHAGNGAPAPATANHGATPPAQAQPHPQATATAQPTAQAAPGTTTVVKVTTKKGENAKGPYTNYRVTFADGRTAGTFSDTLGGEMQQAAKSKVPVNPVVEQDGKYWNLTGLQAVVAAPPPPAEEPQHPDEPVTGPEKVLTVRKVTTDQGNRWVIQTDKRALYTDNEQHATDAVDARKNGHGVVPAYETMAAGSGRTLNRLTALAVDKPAAAPAADRQPGEEG